MKEKERNLENERHRGGNMKKSRKVEKKELNIINNERQRRKYEKE